MPRSSSIPYRPEVDSLRAIAVTLVIVFHSRFGALPGGFAGVDVFFVISGFLITSIIKAQIEAGTFTIRGFYASRIRRIVPPILFLALALAIVCTLLPVYTGRDYLQFFRSLHSALLFYSNVYYCLDAGYFEISSTSQMFLHTWSLSVEAQFYLLYPFFLILVTRVWRGREALVLLFAALVFFAGALICVRLEPKVAFYFFPTRAWELLLGGYVAVSEVTPPRQGQKTAFALAGLALIFASSAVFNRFVTPTFPGEWALAPCLGAAMYLAGMKSYARDGVLMSLMTSRALVFTGLISYSLYLWHWPLFVVYGQLSIRSDMSIWAFLTLCAASYCMAMLSYFLVEHPARRKLACHGANAQIAAFTAYIALATSAVFIIHAPIYATVKYCHGEIGPSCLWYSNR